MPGDLSPTRRFAENLKRARAAAGLSQEELAEWYGCHRSEISVIERAGREPRLEKIVKLAACLGVTVETLCEGIEWNAKTRRFRARPSARRGPKG